MPATYVLTLYVAGGSAASARARAAIERLCRELLDGRYRLEVVDVVRDPEAAEAARIVATPTLVREAPPPVRRIVGDLSDHARVLANLDLEDAVTPAAPIPERPE